MTSSPLSDTVRTEDIAVIGVACRFPGAPDPEAYWGLLTSGTVAIGPIPADRATGDPSGRAGLLVKVDEFDAEFFGISPRAASHMDPQQRLMLELGWEGLEDAGLRPDAQAGVFVGAMADDYTDIVRGRADVDAHTMAGLHRGMLANRLSHHLGLTGPSLTVDTGQSSSLTAVYLACASLRQGETRVALAGGVNLLLSAERGRETGAFGGLSPLGRSYPFDARADGFVRGEGGGLVVLKPLADALADGDRVYCVIRGGAINHDGGEGALTVPHRAAQEDLLCSAWRDAGIDPSEAGYVELHGTGTTVGDPIEAAALGTVLGSPRSSETPLRVGSVKSSIGHLEGAAGIAGLIKTVLTVERGEFVPTLNFATPNPRIPLDELRLRVQVDRAAWTGPRVAGVSSFGMGGANAHLVLSQAPQKQALPAAEHSVTWRLSAATPQALLAQAEALHARLSAHSDWRVEDVAHSLSRRKSFEQRAVIIAADRERLLAGLRDVAIGTVVSTGDSDLLALARQWVSGDDVEIPQPVGTQISLPTYMFQRRRHWIGEDQTAPAESAPVKSTEHLALVRQSVAAVLQYSGASEIAPDTTFTVLGLESLDAVELTAELEAATGLTLPISLVYDHPTPRAVAAFLASELAGDTPADTDAPVHTPTTDDEPIAIVGIGCRYPGGIASPEDLWDVVAGERDVLGEFPADRGWDLERLFSGDGRGTSYLREGGFIADAAEFDAGFFGISPREAVAMDPQQRLLLQVSWEAVERAGIDPLTLRDTATGVFAGVIPQQYDSLVQQASENLDGYVYTGSTPSVLAGRVAYSLGLRGPALAVDTACSSSLVALHLACQSLRRGESSLALAGGVTVMATPLMFTDFSRQGALSSNGRSKAFAAAADGTGWSEGAGMVVLERLSDAQRNGHQVLAVIRGSAVNEDGASNGLTAPHGPAQRLMVRQALANARLSPGDVDVVEAHGPGTTLGDPIEANALLATYGADRDPRFPLWLGSVKSNIGHTQAAAGVAGVIKMVQALRHEVLPRSLHIDRPTPHVDWSAGTVLPLQQARPWPDAGRPRRAGVSAFGAGGTNAHVILEAAPPEPHAEAATSDVLAWPVSAKTAQAVADQAGRLHSHLLAHPEIPAVDVARTLAARSAFDHRAVAIGGTRDELLANLRNIESSPVPDIGEAGPVFVFPGQGSQWPGMADGLLGRDPVFTASAEECAAAFGRYLDWSVLDVLRAVPGTPPLDRVDVTQPVLFTMMVSLAAMWRSRGIEPAAVVGHSQGEITAAFVAGALTLDDAVKIIALRSRALLGLAGQGAMASLSLPLAETREMLLPWENRLDVAAVNGPSSTTVGGEPAALAELLDTLTEREVRFRRLPGVTNAGHSAQIDPLREHLMSVLADVAPRPATIAFYSTVTRDRVDTTTLDAAYWWRNAREPVLFEPAVRALLAAGHRFFFEVNPHPLLQVGLAETIAAADVPAVVLSTLRRGEDPSRRFLLSVAEAYTHGLAVDWVTGGGPRASLPTYPFQTRHYWAYPVARSSEGAVGHPLLTGDLPLPHVDGHLLTARLSAHRFGWLTDHALLGGTVLPGTALLELAWTAAQRVGANHVDELVLESPVVLPEDGDLELQVAVEPQDGAYSVRIHSRQSGSPWTRHVHGRITHEIQSTVDIGVWPPAGATAVELGSAYPRLRERGYHYGPAFQGLRGLWRRGEEIFADVVLPDDLADQAGGFALHPALLDAALHAILVEAGHEDSVVLMPFSWDGYTVHADGAAALRVRVVPSGSHTYSLAATDGTGHAVFSAEGVSFRPVPVDKLRSGSAPALTRLVWSPADLAPAEGEVVVIEGLGYESTQAFLDSSTVTDTLVVHLPPETGHDVPATIHKVLREHTRSLTALLELHETHLTLLTHNGTADRTDLTAATIRGLWRSASSEHPGRISLVDIDGTAASEAALPAALTTRLPDVALHDGVAHTPSLRPVPAANELTRPETGAWKLGTTGAAGTATLDQLELTAAPEYDEPLRPEQVRVTVRAAGLNFVDVITSMGMFPGTAGLGREFAGVVTETGTEVRGVAVGDRVFGIVGLAASSIAPTLVTDHQLVAPIPEGWTYAQAAGVPIAFLTAYYGLVELAGLDQRDRLLVHAATGGVGMAALQLAASQGAEVFATAHPDKWVTLAGLGLDGTRIASSRTLEFADRFGDMDIVLNALANEFVDASLDVLRAGGRFLEMGKLDIRPADDVAKAHPGVTYQPFDILSVEPGHIADMLTALLEQFDSGALRPLPVRTWDVGQAREAFRTFRDARHTGKLVLTFPAPLDPQGTVLVTGGTGTLGAAVARHLAEHHGVRHLLLTSRHGSGAPGAAELQAELGATITAHDLADPGQVTELLAGIPPAHPLTAVVHAAGVLRDATITSLTGDELDEVLRPKLDAAWHLHQQTRHLDLAQVTFYSSVAGTLGGAGQANYAAANSFLDALARRRDGEGLPTRAIAWGLWAQRSAMSGHLEDRDVDRMAQTGLAPLSTEDGLALFDTAWHNTDAAVVAARLDPSSAVPDHVSPLLRDLIGHRTAPRRVVAAPQDLRTRWAVLAETEREDTILAWVRDQVAAVLRLPDSAGITDARALRDLGFDSLTSVELRNRFNSATGLRLPVTVVFDHPTAEALATFLGAQLFPDVEPAVPARRETAASHADLDTADTDELLRLIDAELEDGDR